MRYGFPRSRDADSEISLERDSSNLWRIIRSILTKHKRGECVKQIFKDLTVGSSQEIELKMSCRVICQNSLNDHLKKWNLVAFVCRLTRHWPETLVASEVYCYRITTRYWKKIYIFKSLFFNVGVHISQMQVKKSQRFIKYSLKAFLKFIPQQAFISRGSLLECWTPMFDIYIWEEVRRCLWGVKICHLS